MKIEIIEAGVDPNHNPKTCDWCGYEFQIDEDGYDDEISTCTHTEYVKLCRKCYRKAGNKVR